jgi:hypothetical protein
MTALDSLISVLQSSDKLDPGKKQLLLDFFQTAAPLLSNLESATLGELMTWLAGADVPPPTIVDSLTQAQVLALLTETHTEMEVQLQERLQQVAAARAAIGNLGNLALSLLIRTLLSVL